MISVDKAVIARLKKSGKSFEILVDCDKALEMKEGKSVGFDDVVATDMIFKDVKKGDKASEHELKNIFGSDDFEEVAKIIIKQGEIQLTAQHQSKIREEKRKKLINIIHRNAIDSKTGLPHPPQRIESAMEEAKVRIDENKTAEQQVEDVLKLIRAIIPIKFEIREIAIRIPAQYASQSFHVLKKFGKLLRDEWQNDGSLMAVIEIPAGIQEEFEGQLNKIAHGEMESKILRTK